MTRLFHTILSLMCAGLFWSSMACPAQDVFTPPQPDASVADAEAREALWNLRNARMNDYTRPEVLDSAGVVLKKMAAGTLPVEGRLEKLAQITEWTAAAGRREDLPALLALTRHPSRRVRDALAIAQRITLHHSAELLLALIQSAESALPATGLSDRKEAEERMDEFYSRVVTYCVYTAPLDRGPAKEATERFLKRYDDPSIRRYYEPKFQATLASSFPQTAASDIPAGSLPPPEDASYSQDLKSRDHSLAPSPPRPPASSDAPLSSTVIACVSITLLLFSALAAWFLKARKRADG